MRRLFAIVCITVLAGAAWAAKPAPAKPAPAKPAPAKPAPAPAALEGEVTQVIDGGTFVLQIADGKNVTVRLSGIEPLESCQPWGSEAGYALKEWLHGLKVAVKPEGKDASGRVLGVVQLEGRDLAGHVVEEGNAFSTRTKWDQGPYVKQERVARALGRGIYSTGQAQTPADYRRTHPPCPPPSASAPRN